MVAGMSFSFRSRNSARAPAFPICSSTAGPSATNSSSPTLKIPTSPAKRRTRSRASSVELTSRAKIRRSRGFMPDFLSYLPSLVLGGPDCYLAGTGEAINGLTPHHQIVQKLHATQRQAWNSRRVISRSESEGDASPLR
ncbi:hypothetical protein DFAR_2760002 [Desulfarculales bacterium]